MSNQTCSEEIPLGDSESTPLRSRQSVKPSDPGYDAHVLAHIKANVVIDPLKGCWLWQGFIFPDAIVNGKTVRRGYGGIGYRGRNSRTHRVMWVITKGSIPTGMHVCHTCDVRHCCNPDHLWLGTNRENITDMVKKGRGPCGVKATKTHCIRGHAFAEHAYYAPGNPTWRKCRICDEDRKRTPKYVEAGRVRQRRRHALKRAARLAQQGVAS